MTSLLAWIGVDSRTPSSIYLVSDSRITWTDPHFPTRIWDYGRKLFASRKHPEILGYCGDVLFPSQVLGQLIDIIDADSLFDLEESPNSKWGKVVTVIQQSFEAYPLKEQGFTIIYCTRENSGLDLVFHMFTLRWDPNKGWTNNQELDLPEKSGIISTFGSGKKFVDIWYSHWNNTREKGTSRIVFSAFCDALHSGGDAYSGGAPQLVGLYRTGCARSFGVIYQGVRYLLGIPVTASNCLDNVEWRNSLFERCDWQTLQRLEDAQSHHKPHGLGKA